MSENQRRRFDAQFKHDAFRLVQESNGKPVHDSLYLLDYQDC